MMMMMYVLYQVNTMKQIFNNLTEIKSSRTHATPLGHIILILNQSLFVFTPQRLVPSRERTHFNLVVFGLIIQGIELTFYNTRCGHTKQYTRCSPNTSIWYNDREITYVIVANLVCPHTTDAVRKSVNGIVFYRVTIIETQSMLLKQILYISSFVSRLEDMFSFTLKSTHMLKEIMNMLDLAEFVQHNIEIPPVHIYGHAVMCVIKT